MFYDSSPEKRHFMTMCFNCWMKKGNLKFRCVGAVIWIVGNIEDTFQSSSSCSTNQMTRLTNMNFVVLAYHSSMRYSPAVFFLLNQNDFGCFPLHFSLGPQLWLVVQTARIALYAQKDGIKTIEMYRI